MNDLIHDKYTVIQLLHETKSSYIFEVKDERKQLKVLKVARNIDTRINEQIMNEARILAKVEHPKIPKLYDKLIIEDNYHAIVMDKITGSSLADRMKHVQQPFDWQAIQQITSQLLSVVQVFHTQSIPIILRDIKPSNILLTDDHQLFLIDFGVAKPINELQQSNAMGTIGFSAPEQFECGEASVQSDLFSIGATLFYLLSNGENIYTKSMKDLQIDKIPFAYMRWIKQLTETVPHKRIATIQQAEKKFKLLSMSKRERILHYFIG